MFRRDIQWFPDGVGRDAGWIALDPWNDAMVRFSGAQRPDQRGELSTQEHQIARAAGLLRDRPAPTPKSADKTERVGTILRARRDWLTNLLFLRIPLFHADRWAARTAQNFGAFFGPAAFALTMMLFVISILSVACLWDAFSSELVAATSFDGPTPYVMLAVFVLIKALHESAHAIACRHHGAQVGRIGIVLMCGIPSAYCDVSAIQIICSRWRRILVMLAGVQAECMIAFFATLVWVLTLRANGGLIHLIAFQTMILCGVSSFLFHFNPLMRYDGHFVLSDLVNTPNLFAEASVAYRQWFRRQSTDRASSRQRWLILFHLTSSCYRLIVTAGLGGMLIMFFESLTLLPVGWLIAVTLFAISLRNLVQNLVPPSTSAGNPRGILARCRRPIIIGIIVLLGLAVLFVPLPRGVTLRGEIESADVDVVYAPASGFISQWLANDGAALTAGEPVVRIENYETRLASVIANADQAQQSIKLRQLRRQAGDPDADLSGWQVHLASLRTSGQTAAAASRSVQDLVIRSRQSGCLRPLGEQLPDIGSTVTKGQRLAIVIVDPTPVVAVSIPAPLALQLHAGQSVDVQLEQFSGTVFQAFISEIRFEPANDGNVSTRSNHERFVLVKCRFVRRVDQPPILAGPQARVRFQLPRQSIATKGWYQFWISMGGNAAW